MNGTQPVDVINAVFEQYTDLLASEFARLSAATAERVYTEAGLRRSDGELATEGESGFGTRVDVAMPAEGKFLMVDTPSLLSFPSFQLLRGPIEFTVSPFAWDACSVKLACTPASFQWQPVVDWFHRWFDADDLRRPDERGLCGIVHFLSEPLLTQDGVSLTTDLGSAPVQAFLELLDACACSRPSSAIVWTSLVQ
jgi:hypothetical protein